MAYGPRSAGADMLTDWARHSLVWTDVNVDVNETSYEAIVRSPESEFGRRICVAGFVSVTGPDSSGGLGGVLWPSRDGSGPVQVMFVTHGVAPRPPRWGRLCGVVAGAWVVPPLTYEGRQLLPQKMSIKIIGLFDLRQNR